MKAEYMKIKEFAQRVGISQQAVYKQLNNRLKDYVTVIDGKKWIDKRALELYEPKVNSTTKSTDEQPMNNQFNIELIQMLRDELAEKNRTIAELQKSLNAERELVKEAHLLLKNEQELHGKRILELEAKQVNEATHEQEISVDAVEKVEVPETNQSFFKKLFLLKTRRR
jgi:hypothetical protein